jgi:hypothetical protein
MKSSVYWPMKDRSFRITRKVDFEGEALITVRMKCPWLIFQNASLLNDLHLAILPGMNLQVTEVSLKSDETLILTLRPTTTEGTP